MIKHKTILIFLSIFFVASINSCGGGTATDTPNPDNEFLLTDDLTMSDDQEIADDTLQDDSSDNSKILNNESSYQEGDMHLNELNLQIKKLEAELDHYKSNLRELSAKAQVWGNPFTVYNKEIILTNGTTVFGKIVYQDRDVVKVETLIGKLIIDRLDLSLIHI